MTTLRVSPAPLPRLWVETRSLPRAGSGELPSNLSAQKETQQRPQSAKKGPGGAQAEMTVTPARAHGEHWCHPA